MRSISSATRAGGICLALTATLFGFAGCGNNEQPPPISQPSAGAPGGAPNSAGASGGKMAASGGGSGQALLAANCRCHSGGRAPDLSHFGADPTHTAGWIAEYAANPKSKDPKSRMPPMEGKVSSDDLKTIATYVASLK
jgi:mono/diheme cytochrome c family protein